MNEETIALVIMSGLIFLIFLGFLVWGLVSGQFKHSEDAKYQVFKSDDEIKEEIKSENTKKVSQEVKKC